LHHAGIGELAHTLSHGCLTEADSLAHFGIGHATVTLQQADNLLSCVVDRDPLSQFCARHTVIFALFLPFGNRKTQQFRK
jgi:hypothetical protein